LYFYFSRFINAKRILQCLGKQFVCKKANRISRICLKLNWLPIALNARAVITRRNSKNFQYFLFGAAAVFICEVVPNTKKIFLGRAPLGSGFSCPYGGDGRKLQVLARLRFTSPPCGLFPSEWRSRAGPSEWRSRAGTSIPYANPHV
jgi:hypothetical protein